MMDTQLTKRVRVCFLLLLKVVLLFCNQISLFAKIHTTLESVKISKKSDGERLDIVKSLLQKKVNGKY